MKKSVKVVLLIAFIVLILLVAGCTRKECKKDTECKKTGFTSSCLDNSCVHIPIPGLCGNDVCEANADENECTCPSDCGVCAGAVPGSTLLQKTCINENTECTVDVPSNKVNPVSITNTINSQGNIFKVTSTFNQPFNFKKDKFTSQVLLDNVGRFISNIRITGYELSGTNAQRQNIVLVDKAVSKPIPFVGGSAEDELILDVVTSDLEGIVTNPNLKIDYEYTLTSGASSQLRTAEIFNVLRGFTFQWVKPTVDYGCPSEAECDDGNAGTTDSCGPETNFFCEHTPIAGACGNFQCDAGESKCSCPSDCGPCSGSAGQYMDLSCSGNNCVANARSGISVTPVSIFDDRNLGAIHLNNRFTYNKPFNAVQDSISAEINLFNKRDDVSAIMIDSVRALDGTKELGFVAVNKELTAIGQPIIVSVPITFVKKPEAEHFVALSITYSYSSAQGPIKATFSKSLEKITFYSPGTI